MPLIVTWPEHIKPGINNKLISLTDLPVTFSFYLDTVFPYTDGEDLSDLLRSPEANGPTLFLFSVLFLVIKQRTAVPMNGAAYYTFVRNGKRKQTIFFDNDAEPYQLNNLADNPKHSHLQAKLNAKLDQKLKDCGYHFRPWRQMVQEDHFLKTWNKSQTFFHRKPLISSSEEG